MALKRALSSPASYCSPISGPEKRTFSPLLPIGPDGTVLLLTLPLQAPLHPEDGSSTNLQISGILPHCSKKTIILIFIPVKTLNLAFLVLLLHSLGRNEKMHTQTPRDDNK